jgi:hypothetical protein
MKIMQQAVSFAIITRQTRDIHYETTPKLMRLGRLPGLLHLFNNRATEATGYLYPHLFASVSNLQQFHFRPQLSGLRSSNMTQPKNFLIQEL